jgi:hypothetical protein
MSHQQQQQQQDPPPDGGAFDIVPSGVAMAQVGACAVCVALLPASLAAHTGPPHTTLRTSASAHTRTGVCVAGRLSRGGSAGGGRPSARGHVHPATPPAVCDS